MIISCEHNTGMGMCSACSKEVSDSYDKLDRESKRRSKLQQMISDLESEGEYIAAERMRKKLKSL